jgi:hypothetical protein
VKNTKPKFSLSPPVIADFTLKMNEVKTEEVKGMLDLENSEILMGCWKEQSGKLTELASFITPVR